MRSGTVSSSLLDLLAPQAERRTSGVVTATRKKLKRLLCLEKGRLVHAVSNVIEEQLAERLVTAGHLNPADRSALEREAVRSKRRFAAILREAGLVDPSLLFEAMTEHVRELTLDCLRWTEGQFRLEPGLPDLSEEIRGDVSIAGIVVRHVGRHPTETDMVRVRIGPPDLLVRVEPGIRERLGLDADPTLDHVTESATEPRAVGDLASTAPEGPDRAYRWIYALLLLRVLRRADTVSGAQAARAEAAEREVTREEIEGWISRARTATHFDILGVSPGSSLDDIRAGYYRHARRLHPDRVRSGPHADLLPQVEEFFGKVTEAYNTLHDPDRRREYERVLADTERRTREPAQGDTAYLARQNFLRAMAARDRRRLSEALSFLENAVRLDDANAEYRRELGRILATNPRRRGEAEGHLRRAAEIDPSSPETYLALADFLARAGRGDEALDALRETLRWDPANDTARRRLRDAGIDPDAVLADD